MVGETEGEPLTGPDRHFRVGPPEKFSAMPGNYL